MLKLLGMVTLIVLGVVYVGGAVYAWFCLRNARREIDEFYKSLGTSDY